MSGWQILGLLLLIAGATGLIMLWIGGAFHDTKVRRQRDASTAANTWGRR